MRKSTLKTCRPFTDYCNLFSPNVLLSVPLHLANNDNNKMGMGYTLIIFYKKETVCENVGEGDREREGEEREREREKERARMAK